MTENVDLPQSFEGTCEVTIGKRTEYVTTLPVDLRRTDLARYQGQVIKLNGKDFRVAGVHSRCTEQQRAGWPIGLVGEFIGGKTDDPAMDSGARGLLGLP